MGDEINIFEGERNGTDSLELKTVQGTVRRLDLDVEPESIPLEPQDGYILVKNIATALGVSKHAIRHYLNRRGFDLLKVRLYETRGQPTLALRREDVPRFVSMWTSEGRPMTPEAEFLLATKHSNFRSPPPSNEIGSPMRRTPNEVRASFCLSGIEVRYAEVDVLSLEFQQLKDIVLGEIPKDKLDEYDLMVEFAARRRDDNSSTKHLTR